jgi:hypothetical protein
MKPPASIDRSPVERTAADDARARRVESARANHRWTELEEVDLVVRGPFLVSAATDAVFVPYRGATFGRSGRIEFAELVELYFVVRDGDVTMLERQAQSWSEVLARRTRASAS